LSLQWPASGTLVMGCLRLFHLSVVEISASDADMRWQVSTALL